MALDRKFISTSEKESVDVRQQVFKTSRGEDQEEDEEEESLLGNQGRTVEKQGKYDCIRQQADELELWTNRFNVLLGATNDAHYHTSVEKMGLLS